MSDEKREDAAVNPHTGRPVPDDVHAPGSPPAPGASSPDLAPRRDPSRSLPPGSSQGSGTPPEATPASNAAPASPAPGAALSQQELAVRSALETVMDPEIGLSVIDLGLIREVLIQPEKTLIRMMLTTPFCPYAPQLMADVKQATMSVVPQECEVEILPDPWSPDLMPDPGLLGFSY